MDGLQLPDYQFAQTFSYDWGALNYMQDTLGIVATNQRLRAETLPVWYWHARWFRPSQEEEFSLYFAWRASRSSCGGPAGPDWAGLVANPTAVVLTLRAGEQLAGAAIGRLTTAGSGQVDAVYVAPRWRRRYWGSALAEGLQAGLQERGAQEISALVEQGNPTSTAFWANLGWEPARQAYMPYRGARG